MNYIGFLLPGVKMSGYTDESVVKTGDVPASSLSGHIPDFHVNTADTSTSSVIADESPIEVESVGPASRLRKDEVFKNFQDFKDVWDLYCDKHHVPFTKKHTQLIETYNKDIKNKYPLDYKYKSVHYYCKHFGERSKSKGTGQRASQ